MLPEEELSVDTLLSSNALFLIYNLGNFFAFIAFWPRDILQLRWFMACSMGLLSVYFFALPGGPILNALFWMVPTFIINVVMIMQHHRERRDHGIADDVRPLYEKIAVLTPAQFRKLIAIASRTSGQGAKILTEGKPSGQLHFLLSGQAKLEKGSKAHKIESGTFLGEVSFINQTVASGTVVLADASECLSWDSRVLADLMKRDMAIDIAMRGIFNRDLAAKVANSVPLQHPAS